MKRHVITVGALVSLSLLLVYGSQLSDWGTEAGTVSEAVTPAASRVSISTARTSPVTTWETTR